MNAFARLSLVVVLGLGCIGTPDRDSPAAGGGTSSNPPDDDDVTTNGDGCRTPADCPGSVPAQETVVEGTVPEQLPPPLPPWDQPCDGVDGDGDGIDPCEEDLDHDGFPASNDCDDQDPRRNMDMAETWCDGIDQNCNGFDDCDSDADGTLDPFDCAPLDPAIDLQCNDGPPSTPGD
jgi:hypothetical protein